jgi:hypothetical protein
MSLKEHVPHGWMVLFKFGAPEHLEQFRKTGLLFMRSSAYFSELERSALADTVRADKFEGSDWIFHPKKHSLTFHWQHDINFTIPSDDIAEHTSLSLNSRDCNIYCMYAVTKPHPVDNQNFAFGTSFVIVLNTFEFLRRFISQSIMIGLKEQHDLVEYYTLDKYSGETGPFRKPSYFAYQSEFRLIVRPGIALRKMVIGNLEDITSEVLPLSEINRIVDLSPEAARKAGLSW